MIGSQGPGSVPLEDIDSMQPGKTNRASQQGSKFFQELAAFARESGVAVDILAAGMAAVNSPLLSRMATDTGGVLLLHQSEPPMSCDIPY